MTIKQASVWLSQHLERAITPANITYLIQYGRIKKHNHNNVLMVSKNNLLAYYNDRITNRKNDWQHQLGSDVNWDLAFDHLREKDTTKHVHRLHPYKGKFIPQLVEYFITNRVGHHQNVPFFERGDIVLDPFAGSGTTLVQANEHSLHAVGVDISAFNALLANVKVRGVDFVTLERELHTITCALKAFIAHQNNTDFEIELSAALHAFNARYFPSPEFKINVRHKTINEANYAAEKLAMILPTFETLRRKYALQIKQTANNRFLDTWYVYPIRNEIDYVFAQLEHVKDPMVRDIIKIILSRTMRSTRATHHADLATLKEPITTLYYCYKHGKICKPLFSILSWWQRYCKDTCKRLYEFSTLRTQTHQTCVQGDARNIDIIAELTMHNAALAALVAKQKIKGLFSSPPYVGLIDYHEQHAYAYDLFGLPRSDDMEIGPLHKGQSKAAQMDYITSIAQVLKNAKRYMQQDYNVFLVANDKYNVYPQIAKQAGMAIVQEYKRPVLNRTERDKSAYSETIFLLQENRACC